VKFCEKILVFFSLIIPSESLDQIQIIMENMVVPSVGNQTVFKYLLPLYNSLTSGI
jgi:hypothetical protein